MQLSRWECAYGEIWASFSGQVGCELNWPLPHRKSAVIFREYLRPSSLYLGSCAFGLWLLSTQQFGDFIAYHNFCYTYHAKIFWGLSNILHFVPSKWWQGLPPTKARVLEDWGLDGIKVPFSTCHFPAVLFWSRQVLWLWHQRCRWGRRPAGSLAQLSPPEVEL